MTLCVAAPAAHAKAPKHVIKKTTREVEPGAQLDTFISLCPPGYRVWAGQRVDNSAFTRTIRIKRTAFGSGFKLSFKNYGSVTETVVFEVLCVKDGEPLREKPIALEEEEGPALPPGASDEQSVTCPASFFPLSFGDSTDQVDGGSGRQLAPALFRTPDRDAVANTFRARPTSRAIEFGTTSTGNGTVKQTYQVECLKKNVRLKGRNKRSLKQTMKVTKVEVDVPPDGQPVSATRDAPKGSLAVSTGWDFPQGVFGRGTVLHSKNDFAWIAVNGTSSPQRATFYGISVSVKR